MKLSRLIKPSMRKESERRNHEHVEMNDEKRLKQGLRHKIKIADAYDEYGDACMEIFSDFESE